jgi:hypothetical protein
VRLCLRIPSALPLQIFIPAMDQQVLKIPAHRAEDVAYKHGTIVHCRLRAAMEGMELHRAIRHSQSAKKTTGESGK